MQALIKVLSLKPLVKFVVLLLKGRPKEEQAQISCVAYDIEQVKELYQKALSKLNEHVGAEGFVALKELLVVRRNFEVLQLDKCMSPQMIDTQRGKITAITGLMHDLVIFREKTFESDNRDIKDNITMIKKKRRSGSERSVSI